MAQEKSTLMKRSGGKHFSISPIHEAAMLRLVDELKDLFPEKKKTINASSTLEWMIEKICGKSDPELKKLIELRNEMNKLNKEKEK